MDEAPRLEALRRFPLLDALFGRRARRFGMGMEIPSGPLAFKSTHDPLPLSELEQAILIAAATGVSGWSFGVPFGPRTPGSHAEFTVRFTGRPTPTAAGIGTPALFHTDDHGCYGTRTRDVRPEAMQTWPGCRHPKRRPDVGARHPGGPRRSPGSAGRWRLLAHRGLVRRGPDPSASCSPEAGPGLHPGWAGP